MLFGSEGQAPSPFGRSCMAAVASWRQHLPSVACRQARTSHASRAGRLGELTVQRCDQPKNDV